MRLLLLMLAPLTALAESSPEQRALAYLAQEVPRWSKDNGCFSCHNNGDAARALYRAHALGLTVPGEALADTTAWLMRPAAWDQNRGDPRFSDKKLARIQFAAALASAVAAGLAPRDRLAAAGESLLPYQESDGSWQVDTAAALGSPVTYGAAMATYMARKTLQAADPSRFRQAIDLAGAWFAKARPKSVLDAAALLLADGARQDCLELLMRSQTGDGGWGPYPGTPAEVFDTAVALLALCGRPDLSERLQRGRGWLVRAQLPEGGWRETTRPSGAQSYAQHISTSGWAALALLETRK